MSNAFIDKLTAHVALSRDDISMLEAECANARDIPARHDLIRDGDPSGPLFVILEGWACRYKMLPDGGRQITAFLLPGDFCDMHGAELDKMDHSIATLTRSRVAMIPRAKMAELSATRPAITRAFWRMQLIDEGVLRAWIVSMGRRDSFHRVAHLLCELCVRTQSINLVNSERYELPISQIVLADALGLTPVHINRVLRDLRLHGVMERHARLLVIVDLIELGVVAGFDGNYLHRSLRRTG